MAVRDACALVGGEVVHDHDVARGERGSEDLLDIGEERRPVHRAVEHHRHGHHDLLYYSSFPLVLRFAHPESSDSDMLKRCRKDTQTQRGNCIKK